MFLLLLFLNQKMKINSKNKLIEVKLVPFDIDTWHFPSKIVLSLHIWQYCYLTGIIINSIKIFQNKW